MRKNKIAFRLVPVIFLVVIKNIFPQISIDDYLKKVEERINQAAESYLDKNFEKSLDLLRKTTEFVSDHSFPATDRFAWEACRCVKTYSVLFSRIVEEKMVEKRNDKKLTEALKGQALEWAKILETQAYGWSKIETNNVEQIKLRRKWLKRFSSMVIAVDKESC